MPLVPASRAWPALLVALCLLAPLPAASTEPGSCAAEDASCTADEGAEASPEDLEVRAGSGPSPLPARARVT